MFEYKMVQLPPNVVVKEKGQQGNEAAHYLQSLANGQAAQAWEFYRVDTVGIVTQPGCLGAFLGAKQQLVEYFVVTFRRPQRA